MFKKIIITMIAAAVIFIGLTYFLFQQKTGENKNNAIEIITVNDKELIAEIADEPHEQVLGLSGREKLAENQGMLFVFPEPISPGFWMKDMNFNIDIIWINKDGLIVGIEKNISPDTYPNSFFPPSPVKYVLEVNASWSDHHNIKIGENISF